MTVLAGAVALPADSCKIRCTVSQMATASSSENIFQPRS